MRTLLLLGNVLVLTLFPSRILAQQHFPEEVGGSIRYNAQIETPKGYVSGICILLNDSTEIKGSFFNEFGISAIDYSYLKKKEKIKLHHVMGFMNKWYIKKQLKKDLLCLMHNLRKETCQYKNDRYNITYSLTPMPADQQKSDYETTE